MSIDWYKDIIEFTDTVIENRMTEGKNYPHAPTGSILDLKINLIDEEVNKELIPALKSGDILAIADGAVDSIVVILGAMISAGIDIRPIWDEIHRTNLAKKGGPFRADGKRMKPEGWLPPDIAPIIEAQIIEAHTPIIKNTIIIDESYLEFESRRNKNYKK